MRKFLLGAAVAASLVACSSSDAPPVLVAASDARVDVGTTVANAVTNTSFNYATGVPALGTSGTATTVVFTDSAASPAFRITSGTQSATGVTTFGSCIFRVTSSTYPAGHALALGQTVTVNPCAVNLSVTGAVANGQAISRSAALVLGAANSAGASVTVGVNANGGIVLNGTLVTTIGLTPATGGN